MSRLARNLLQSMSIVVAVMSLGRLLAAGPIDSVRSGRRLEDAFIEMVGASPVGSDELAWLDRPR